MLTKIGNKTFTDIYAIFAIGIWLAVQAKTAGADLLIP